MKEYPSGNEYPSDPPAETQRFHNASNQTRTQSGTVETTRNEGFGGGMKLYPYPPSAEHNSAAGNNKAAVNSWLVNESITRSLSTSPDARPKFLEVPGLPPSHGDLGSPPSWGIQYNNPLVGRDRPYDPDHPYDPGEPDEDYPSGVPRAKEPLPRMLQLTDGNQHRPRDAPKRFLSEDLHSMVAPSDPASRGDVFLRASGGSFFR